MQAQARICPVCIDDHSIDRECKPADLKEEIARLRKAIVMLALGDIFWSSVDREVWLLRGPGDCPSLPCDGSPEQIVATVCRLAGGE